MNVIALKRAALLATLFFAQITIARPAPALADIQDLNHLTERWEGLAEELGVAGYAVALIRDNKLIAAQGFGVRDPLTSQPVDADTIFYVASCTKTYIAAAIVKLADQGAIDLDAPVQRYLPEFTLADADAASSITLRDLLGHTPGLNSPMAVYLDAYTGTITDELYFRWLSRETPAGEIVYTNIHYTLLGRVIERVTGKDWREYLDVEVFTPAAMNRTTAYASEMYTDPNAAFPAETGPHSLQRAETVKTDAVMHAAGGIGASVLDAAQWVLLHLNEGAVGESRAFSPEAMEEILTYQSHFDEPRGGIRTLHGYTAAWQAGVWRRGDARYYQHAGGYTGTAALFSFMPDEGLGVVVLANHTPEGRAMCDVISIDYYDHMLSVTERTDPLPWYINNISEYRSQEPTIRDRLTSDRLSLPARSYLGAYHAEDLGRLDVVFERGELAVRIGNMRYAARADNVDPSPDALLLESDGDAIVARFIVEKETPSAIELEFNNTVFRFNRNE